MVLCAFATYKAIECYPELGDKVTYCNPANRDFDSYISPQYENLINTAEDEGLDISEFTDIVNRGPEYVAENYAWESAGYYWYMNGCNEIVDSFTDTDPNNVDDITSIVNFGNSHCEEKIAAYEEIKEYVN